MLRDLILERMIELGGNGVSLAQLEDIPGFSGEWAWGGGGYKIYLWDRMSEEAIDTLSSLTREKVIEARLCEPIAYLVDGRMPDLPVATEERVYDTPHWAPMMLYLKDLPEEE